MDSLVHLFIFHVVFLKVSRFTEKETKQNDTKHNIIQQ